MAVSTQVKTAVVQWARWWEAVAATWAANVTIDFDAIVDAAADTNYENYARNAFGMADVDTAMEGVDIGNASQIALWFARHREYVTASTSGIAHPGLGASALSDIFAVGANSYNWAFPAPWGFAQLYYRAMGVRLPAASVGAKGVWTATIGDNVAERMHKFGRFTKGTPNVWTASDGAINATNSAVAQGCIGAPVLLNGVSAANDTAGKVRCTSALGTVRDWDFAAADIVGIDDQYMIAANELTITDSITAGDTVLPVTGIATGDLAPGDYALLFNFGGPTVDNTEVVCVASVQHGISLTVTQGVKGAALAGLILPLYVSAYVYSTTAGTNGKLLDVYAMPSFTLAWAA